MQRRKHVKTQGVAYHLQAQEGDFRIKPNLLTPCSGTYSLENSEEMEDGSLSHSTCGALLWQLFGTHTPSSVTLKRYTPFQHRISLAP